MKIAFTLNGKVVELEAPENANLLWTLRDRLKLTGTKYACGIAQCGACTVHLDGKPVRSCTMPLKVASGREITTIEGLKSEEGLHPLQEAWIEAQVPQCGYCQSGQIMQAAALLSEHDSPTHEEITDYMNGILCRCGAYMRVRKAIKLASAKINPQ